MGFYSPMNKCTQIKGLMLLNISVWDYTTKMKWFIYLKVYHTSLPEKGSCICLTYKQKKELDHQTYEVTG